MVDIMAALCSSHPSLVTHVATEIDINNIIVCYQNKNDRYPLTTFSSFHALKAKSIPLCKNVIVRKHKRCNRIIQNKILNE